MIAVGDKFCRLEVIGQPFLGDKSGKCRRAYAVCQCDCGEIVVARTDGLGKKLKSCGCLKREKAAVRMRALGKSLFRGGFHTYPSHGSWHSMMRRCYRVGNVDWKWYGGRGIGVCPEWHDFLTFNEWAVSSGHQRGLTIDRIDNDADYSPSNCWWITQSENSKKAHPKKAVAPA